MNTKKDYVRLLTLLFEVVEANRGPLNDVDDILLYAEGLAQKFFFHATSILYLSEETNMPNFPSTPLKFIDSPSVDVLARAAFETFLVFHYIYIAPKTHEEKEFRYLAWTAELVKRQYLPVSTQEHQQKLAKERKDLDDLHKRLRSNASFQKLTTKQQKDVLEGRWRLLSWQKIAEDAGLAKVLAANMYGHLSGYAHSGFISVLQIKQAFQKREQALLVESSMQVVLIAAANFIRGYCDLFPKAKQALNRNTNGILLVDELVTIGQNLDH